MFEGHKLISVYISFVFLFITILVPSDAQLFACTPAKLYKNGFASNCATTVQQAVIKFAEDNDLSTGIFCATPLDQGIVGKCQNKSYNYYSIVLYKTASGYGPYTANCICCSSDKNIPVSLAAAGVSNSYDYIVKLNG